MRSKLAAAILLCAAPADAHRLDEYLQATLISVESNRVQAEMRLTPGVAVLPVVLAAIDTDGDGVVSEAEQRAYAERVLRDLSLTLDGERVRLRLDSMKFPDVAEMKEGRGEIELVIAADVPRNGPGRKLVFENRHQRGIGAYLVNCLVPRDPAIRITGQARNYEQSVYQLNYEQAGGGASGRGWVGALALILCGRFALVWRRGGLKAAAG